MDMEDDFDKAVNGDRAINEKKAFQNDKTNKTRPVVEKESSKEPGSQEQPLDKEGDNTVETKDPTKNDKNIPSSVSAQYSEVNGKFYQKNTNRKDKPIFVDKGNKLQARNSNPSTAKALVSIAQARSWVKIKINGNTDFRREAWLEASVRGIAVTGYKPNEGDLAVLAAREKAQPINEISKSENENAKEVDIKTVGSKEREQTHSQELANKIRTSTDLTALASGNPELLREVAIIKAAEKFGDKLKPADKVRFIENVKTQVSANVEADRPAANVNIKVTEQVKAQEQQSER